MSRDEQRGAGAESRGDQAGGQPALVGEPFETDARGPAIDQRGAEAGERIKQVELGERRGVARWRPSLRRTALPRRKGTCAGRAGRSASRRTASAQVSKAMKSVNPHWTSDSFQCVAARMGSTNRVQAYCRFAIIIIATTAAERRIQRFTGLCSGVLNKVAQKGDRPLCPLQRVLLTVAILWDGDRVAVPFFVRHLFTDTLPLDGLIEKAGAGIDGARVRHGTPRRSPSSTTAPTMASISMGRPASRS